MDELIELAFSLVPETGVISYENWRSAILTSGTPEAVKGIQPLRRSKRVTFGFSETGEHVVSRTVVENGS